MKEVRHDPRSIKPNWKCRTCGLVLQNMRQLQIHDCAKYWAQFAVQIFPCNYCDLMFETKRKLMHHIRECCVQILHGNVL